MKVADVVRTTRAPNQCVILTGGLGTRLGELTAGLPKPLLPIERRPFLDFLVSEANRFGFSEILLLAGYRSDAIERYAQERARHFGVSIRVHTESEPAGTGGALWQVRGQLQERFLLLNGDSWFDFNWLALAQTEGAAGALAAIAVRPVEHPERFGPVVLTGSLVSRFESESQDLNSGYVNGGIYLVSHRIVDHLRPNCSLERDVFPALATQERLRAQAFSGRFIDIGVPADLERARAELASWQHRPAVFLDRDGTLNFDSGYVHTSHEFQWLPGAIDAVRALNDAGMYVFVVTNQAGVAHGMYEERDVVALHAWIQSELRDRAAHVDDFRFCPYHANASVAAYRRDDSWRKPKPGMLVDLIQHWPIDVSRSVIFGDKDSDVEAGSSLGIRGVKLEQGGLNSAVTRFLRETMSADGSLVQPRPESLT